jgi:hypothetical protein
MYVFRNGESRTSVNIDKLNGTKFGCNAIMRDYTMDHLVCVDRRMVDEAVKSKVNEHTLIYTRDDWIERYKGVERVRTVPSLPYNGMTRPDQPFQWGSGPYALLLAAMKAKGQTVSLIGFDLYSNTKNVNNMYKGTANYAKVESRNIDPRYWIHQISMVFKCFPKVNFTIYQTHNWELPNNWIQPNISLDNINKL